MNDGTGVGETGREKLHSIIVASRPFTRVLEPFRYASVCDVAGVGKGVVCCRSVSLEEIEKVL